MLVIGIGPPSNQCFCPSRVNCERRLEMLMFLEMWWNSGTKGGTKAFASVDGFLDVTFALACVGQQLERDRRNRPSLPHHRMDFLQAPCWNLQAAWQCAQSFWKVSCYFYEPHQQTLCRFFHQLQLLTVHLLQGWYGQYGPPWRHWQCSKGCFAWATVPTLRMGVYGVWWGFLTCRKNWEIPKFLPKNMEGRGGRYA